MPAAFRFVASARRHTDLPPSPNEVAIVGRSNVGKSSLINALANQRQLAKVSKTPGRTQLLNLFATANGATVVDLPGYGYAKVPAAERAMWQPMIEHYLLQREPLSMVLVLVDGEIGPTPLDAQMLEWLRAERVPHQIVATKIDKVKPSKRAGRRQQLAAACQLDERDVLWVSASTGDGIDALRRHLATLLTSP
jgi:GTP-binding protein